MRKLDEIDKYLYEKYDAIGNEPNISYRLKDCKTSIVHFNKRVEVIEGGLTKLWNDEEIVEVELYTIRADQYTDTAQPGLVFLTNKCRMIICQEDFCVSSGHIFTFTNYYSSIKIVELEYVDINKCRILEIKRESLFGKPKPSLYGQLILDDKSAFSGVLELSVLGKMYDSIMKNIKGFRDSKTESEETRNESEVVVTNSSQNNIAQIRKLYEDNIITKEEMLELIKSALANNEISSKNKG